MTPYVYEVTIRLDKELLDPYLVWLKEHVEAMLKLPCFVGAETFNDSQGPKSLIRVHYFYKEPKDIQIYFDQYADTMRGQLPEVFKNKLDFERNLLERLPW